MQHCGECGEAIEGFVVLGQEELREMAEEIDEIAYELASVETPEEHVELWNERAELLKKREEHVENFPGLVHLDTSGNCPCSKCSD